VSWRETVAALRGDRGSGRVPAGLVATAWAVAAAAACAQFVVTGRHHDLGWDLRPLNLAGKAVLHGRPIYDVPGFVYPPPAALLGVLVSWAPMTFWASAMLAVEIAVLIMLAVVTAGWLVPGRERAVAAAVAATVLLWSHPAVHGLWLGNMSVVMAGIGLAVVGAFARDRWLTGCLLLGLSLLVKPLLLPMVLLPVLRRRIRPLLVAGMVSAVVLLVSCLFTTGLGRLPQVVTKLVGGSVLIGAKSANNLSLTGFAAAHRLPPGVPLVARLLVVVATVAVLVVVLRRGTPMGAAAGGADAGAAAGGAGAGADAAVLACLSSTLLLAVLLAGSLSEVHYVFAVLPGGCAALVSRSTWVRGAVAAGILATVVPLRQAGPIVHQDLLVASEVAFFAAGVLAFLLPDVVGRAAGGDGEGLVHGRTRQGAVPPAETGADTATTASPSSPGAGTGTSVQDRRGLRARIRPRPDHPGVCGKVTTYTVTP
jgi:hypothetical protein